MLKLAGLIVPDRSPDILHSLSNSIFDNMEIVRERTKLYIELLKCWKPDLAVAVRTFPVLLWNGLEELDISLGFHDISEDLVELFQEIAFEKPRKVRLSY